MVTKGHRGLEVVRDEGTLEKADEARPFRFVLRKKIPVVLLNE